MAHNRSISVDPLSSLSSLSSISSSRSVETYEGLKQGIRGIEQSPASLQNLVTAAEKIINDKFALAPEHLRIQQVTYSNIESRRNHEGDASSSRRLRGQEWKTLRSSAIVACGERGDRDEDAIQALIAIGSTWLTHLLFVFKTNRGHENQVPHEFATPTLQYTTSHVGESVGNRGGSFHDDVLMRDEYRCALTGQQGLAHPSPDESAPGAVFQACQILRRAIGKFDPDQTFLSFKSAVTTFDILVNLTRLPVETLEELQSHIDDQSNGMMLELHSHHMFDDFRWCLTPTIADKVYSVKVYKWGVSKPEGTLVTFQDRSDEFRSTATRSRPIPLPNPHYIAIYAALTGILNVSGAGKFFDELLEKYKDDEGNVPAVRCWPELEKVMEEAEIRESVVATLQSIGVF